MSNEYTGNESTLVLGRLRGYRLWNLWDNKLESLNARYIWTPGDQEASCNKIPHISPAPQADCTCGFYARYSSKRLHEIGAISSYEYTIIGAIDAWGRIQLGTKGFRAQYARVVGLAHNFPDRLNLVDIAQAYGVDWFNGVGSLTDAYPPSDLSELLPNWTDDSEEYYGMQGYLYGYPNTYTTYTTNNSFTVTYNWETT